MPCVSCPQITSAGPARRIAVAPRPRARGRPEIPWPTTLPTRPLDLAAAVERKPPYGIVDIGSNSVRLVVYDQLGRAPLPRFNEKSLCRLGEGLAETGAIRPIISVAPSRRRAALPPSPRRCMSASSTSPRRRRYAAPPTGPNWPPPSSASPASRCACWPGRKRRYYSTLGVISGFFRPVGSVGDMGGGSLEVALALDDHVGDVSVSLPLGALPVEAMLAAGPRGGQARDRRAAARRAADDAFEADVLRRRRRLAGARQGAHDGDQGARKGHAWLCAVDGGGAGVRQVDLAHGAAQGRRRPPACNRAAPAACPSAALALDRVLKRLAPERVVFSALGLREGLLYSTSCRARSTIAIRWSRARG